MNETIPRKPSTMYDFMYATPEEKKKKQSQFKFWNKWIVTPLYRINFFPLVGIGKIFVLLYHTGRKSGKQYITPVEYRTKDGKILVFASHGEKTDWYRNIKANPNQTIMKMGFKKFSPKLHFPNVEERIEIMRWYLSNYAKASKMLFGWQDTDEPTDEILKPLAEFIRIIQIER